MTRPKRHGYSGTDIHGIWVQMRRRCENPKSGNYARYGGRGITVCERWKIFENFLADMGERPSGTSIERRNNDGHYEPNNCYWATSTQQNNNRSSNVVLEFSGERLTVRQWAKKLGISHHTIHTRIAKSLPIEEILAPVADIQLIAEYDGKTKPLLEWSRELGLNYATLVRRYHRGERDADLFSNLKIQMIEVNGVKKTLRQAAHDAGLKYTTVYRRFRRGVPLTRVLNSHSLKTGLEL